jgi:hypothetical protein
MFFIFFLFFVDADTLLTRSFRLLSFNADMLFHHIRRRHFHSPPSTRRRLFPSPPAHE